MPTVHLEAGFRFYFYSNEGNEPAHIHIRGKGGKMKIWIPSCKLEYSFGLSIPEKRIAFKVVEINCGKFVNAWNEFREGKI